MIKLTLYFDGAYRFSNDKHEYGCGWLLKEDDEIIEYNHFGGEQELCSVNKAEYMALKDGLEYLIREETLKFDWLTIIGDSKLVIEQLNGNWQVKSGVYVDTAIEVIKILKIRFNKNVSFRWVGRDNNEEADKLSKIGLNG